MHKHNSYLDVDSHIRFNICRIMRTSFSCMHTHMHKHTHNTHCGLLRDSCQAEKKDLFLNSHLFWWQMPDIPCCILDVCVPHSLSVMHYISYNLPLLLTQPFLPSTVRQRSCKNMKCVCSFSFPLHA